MKKKKIVKIRKRCDSCGELKADVTYRENSYAREIGGSKDAMHTVCDECNHQNIMDI